MQRLFDLLVVIGILLFSSPFWTSAQGPLPSPSSGGGTSAPAFNTVTTGTNTAALHIGTGGSLDTSGSGTITATNLGALGQNLLFSPDGTYDIGASGANRPMNVYISNSIQVQTSVLSRFFQSNVAGHGYFDAGAAAGLNFVLENGATGAVGLAVRAIAAQTADQQQWLASGGTTPVARVTIGGQVSGSLFGTETNCSSAASPAVCAAAPAGSVAVPTGVNPTLVVNTTAVTANSQIHLTVDESLGAKLSVTCNTTIPALFAVVARTAATSFTIGITATVATNPVCYSYEIVN